MRRVRGAGQRRGSGSARLVPAPAPAVRREDGSPWTVGRAGVNPVASDATAVSLIRAPA
jgi:hypothetical protein